MAELDWSRCRVGVRCRPPFEDELDADGLFTSAVECIPPEARNKRGHGHDTGLARVEIGFRDGTARDFNFDWAFGPEDDQSAVYNQLAGPIVHDVLHGKHGALFAYGQTGTGKTYTMGILDRVERSSTGIVPRALSHVFGHVAQHPESSWTVTASFIQIYLENVQDLMSTNRSAEDVERTKIDPLRLHIREDPQAGFFVDGVTKYHLSTFSDAVEFINFGLENRAMAPTLMNTTSSRSHTILTLEIEQSPVDHVSSMNNNNYDNHSNNNNSSNVVNHSKTTRSKLLLIDLAGSERVRRTTSKGRRLEEAKSINVSLSALGNVVAALADPQQRSNHIPYRDSKLTKLTADVLAGKSNAALIATVGPALPNISETLSTLLCASRCMDVELKHVETNEVVDYPALCVQLQVRLNNMRRSSLDREERKKSQYEDLIRSLAARIQTLESSSSGGSGGDGGRGSGSGGNDSGEKESRESRESRESKDGSTSRAQLNGNIDMPADLARTCYLTLASTMTILSVLLAERAQSELVREEQRAKQMNTELQRESVSPEQDVPKNKEAMEPLSINHSKALERAFSLTNPMEVTTLYIQTMGDTDVDPVLLKFKTDASERGPASRETWREYVLLVCWFVYFFFCVVLSFAHVVVFLMFTIMIMILISFLLPHFSCTQVLRSAACFI